MDKKLLDKTAFITVLISVIVGCIYGLGKTDIIRWLILLTFFIASFVSTSLDGKICESIINKGTKHNKWCYYSNILIVMCVLVILISFMLGLVVAKLNITDAILVELAWALTMSITISIISIYVHIMLILTFREKE